MISAACAMSFGIAVDMPVGESGADNLSKTVPNYSCGVRMILLCVLFGNAVQTNPCLLGCIPYTLRVQSTSEHRFGLTWAVLLEPGYMNPALCAMCFRNAAEMLQKHSKHDFILFCGFLRKNDYTFEFAWKRALF